MKKRLAKNSLFVLILVFGIIDSFCFGQTILSKHLTYTRTINSKDFYINTLRTSLEETFKCDVVLSVNNDKTEGELVISSRDSIFFMYKDLTDSLILINLLIIDNEVIMNSASLYGKENNLLKVVVFPKKNDKINYIYFFENRKDAYYSAMPLVNFYNKEIITQNKDIIDMKFEDLFYLFGNVEKMEKSKYRLSEDVYNGIYLNFKP